MLPFNTIVNKSNNTIYINPNFKGELSSQTALQSSSIIPKNAHINPLFLEAQKYRNTIHMNPEFFQKFQDCQQQQNVNKNNWLENEPNKCLIYTANDIASNSLCEKGVNTESRKIICKSKNRLIREPLINKDDQPSRITKSMQPFLILNRRKLVRKVSVLPGAFNKSEKDIFGDSKTRFTKYKLDNRVIRKKPLLPPIPKIKRTSYVGRYALKRTSFCEISNISANKSLSINKNKKLQVLNINGLLYKSTRNSLKLKDIKTVRILKSNKSNASSAKLSPNTNQGLIIFVRGNKYVMDANKFKLTRITNYNPDSMASSNSFKASSCQRIDIGGYTYVSVNSAKSVLIRTTNHVSRAYVHNAKQKSLQMLTKRLVKTNIPCPIFQRVGKCAAFDRGKCSKVHNKLQVTICNKFLRGECPDSNCLLSHNVSLSKMPVCKFFLQGVCVRHDCPYLHKKLSNSAELCTEFLRGFCKMADKCNKRHEFVCPEIERNNACSTKNCIYCKEKRRKESQIGKNSEKLKINKNATTKAPSSSGSSTEVTSPQACKRYFIKSSGKAMEFTNENKEQCNYNDTADNDNVSECFEENVENSRKTRPKLGALPAYIPL